MRMQDAFLEIVLDARDLTDGGFEGRDEIEDPLEDVLEASGLAEVTGGGGGSGVAIIDVTIKDIRHLDAVLDLLRTTLKGLGVPRSTVIRQHTPNTTHRVYPAGE